MAVRAPVSHPLRAFVLLGVAALLAVGGNQYRITQNAKRIAATDEQTARNEIQTQRIQANQHITLLASCVRGNIKTAATNQSAYADFLFFSTTLAQTEAFERQEPAQARARGTSLFIQRFREAVDKKVWVPQTDCAAAINESGAAYASPLPVTFVTMLPPPAALTPPRALPGRRAACTLVVGLPRESVVAQGRC